MNDSVLSLPGESADEKSPLEENSADEIENWYTGSDTADDVPDPNQNPDCLYQDVIPFLSNSDRPILRKVCCTR